MYVYLTWLSFPVQARLLSEDYGKHLMGVEDLLQKHNLLEADINVVGERVSTVNSQAQRFIDDDFSEIGGKKQYYRTQKFMDLKKKA